MTDGPLTYQQAFATLRDGVQTGEGLIGDLLDNHEGLADAEKAYRVGKLEAWTRAPAGHGAFRAAWVDAETADLRHARDVAKGRIETTKRAMDLQERRAANITFLGRWSQSEKGQYQ